MTAATYDITIDQGATYALSMIYRGPNIDADTPGDPFDVTGCTAAMQIRLAVGSPVLISATENAGITVGTTDGRIDVILPEEQTILLTTKRARYDLYITFPNGTVRRLLEGKVTIDLTITNPTTE